MNYEMSPMGRMSLMGPMKSRLARVALALTVALASGCAVGPNYDRPQAETPDAYKESSGWKTAQPQDDQIRGSWWEIFQDTELNELEQKVEQSNQDIVAAEAQFRQARSLVDAARSRYFPTLAIGVSAARTHRSANVGGSTATGSDINNYSLPIDISWEPDLWGRVRRSVESNRASAEASAADLASIRLSLQAELADDYFQLRALDAQRRLLDATTEAFDKSLKLTRNRYASGVVARTDVAQAETQLESTRAQGLDIGVRRAQLEHAVALLIGAPPSSFSIPVAPLEASPPPIPVSLPSELLERRPDIAAAERRVAAANAQIGVADSAYYPSVTLSASGGFQGSQLSNWLLWPSRFWSVGPSISETVYDGGLRGAQSDQARAAHDASVASYRQSVLNGFVEVEDNLAALRILDEEGSVQNNAVRAARESVRLATNQYNAGIVSYLNVVITQAAALSNERTKVDILSRRMSASVLLIKALGGGWNPAASLDTAMR